MRSSSWWQLFWYSSSEAESGPADYVIPPGSRKAVLVALALEAWKKGRYDPKEELKEVRGHEVKDEAQLVRALSRTTVPEIEHALEGAITEGELVAVEGRLKGSARTAVDKLGLKVAERTAGEERYVDMTPLVFVFGGVLLATRFLALGMDNQFMYILAGLGFAFLYGLRPFLYRMQRPRED